MTMKELHDKMTNPLDEDSIMDDILDSYHTDWQVFYTNLVQVNSKKDPNKKIVGKRAIIYENALYSYMFQEWKKGIRYLIQNNPNNVFIRDAKVLDGYLRDINPNTREEVMNILNGVGIRDFEVKIALSNFRFDICNSSDFEFFDSSLVYAKSHSRSNSPHKLFINCDSNVMDLLALEFMRKCKERKLKFYFKFDTTEFLRDDGFVIYSDTDTLTEYIEILEEIKAQYYLDNHIHKPPVLSSKINDWIGYGSSPYFVERDSFNTSRVKHIDNCIHQEVGSWIKNNSEGYAIKGDNIYKYGDYLLYKIIAYVQDKCLKNPSIFNYKVDDLVSKEFIDVVKKSLQSRMYDVLYYFETGNFFDTLIIPYKDDIVTVDQNDLDRVFLSQVRVFKNNIGDFKERILERIKISSCMKGISSNYAIDSYIGYVFNEENTETFDESYFDEPKKLSKRVGFRLIYNKDKKED